MSPLAKARSTKSLHQLSVISQFASKTRASNRSFNRFSFLHNNFPYHLPPRQTLFLHFTTLIVPNRYLVKLDGIFKILVTDLETGGLDTHDYFFWECRQLSLPSCTAQLFPKRKKKLTNWACYLSNSNENITIITTYPPRSGQETAVHVPPPDTFRTSKYCKHNSRLQASYTLFVPSLGRNLYMGCCCKSCFLCCMDDLSLQDWPQLRVWWRYDQVSLLSVEQLSWSTTNSPLHSAHYLVPTTRMSIKY